jgi:4'-phosphopantetheinyl transferase
MPLYKTITLTDGLIGIWQLTENSDELINSFTGEELLDSAFMQYTYEKRKVEWLATRLLLKNLIGPNFSISYLETGKPVLNHERYKHISISHSRDFAVIFVNEHSNIGIDIESIHRNFNTVKQRYLSEIELIQVNQNAILQCLYWCAKEAVFKLVPEDSIEFKQQIHISLFDPESEDQFLVKFISGAKGSAYQLHFQLFSDHAMVWVSDKK